MHLLLPIYAVTDPINRCTKNLSDLTEPREHRFGPHRVITKLARPLGLLSMVKSQRPCELVAIRKSTRTGNMHTGTALTQTPAGVHV
jgi:hypothetical protein